MSRNDGRNRERAQDSGRQKTETDGARTPEICETAGKRENDRRYFAENPAALAFLGDAVYEVEIRRYVYLRGCARPDHMNAEAVRFVRAEAQARAYERLLDELEEDELAVSRRAKNHKITSMPGNVNIQIYKKATAFEALLGYLELCGRRERLLEIIGRAINIIESEPIRTDRKR